MARTPIAMRLADNDPIWIHRHIFLPLLATLVVLGALWLGGDMWIADHVYAWEGHAWRLRFHPLTQELIHQQGKHLSTLGWGMALLAYLAGFRIDALRPWRRPLLLVLLSVLLSTGLVALLKQLTGMDCPWDLSRYGGSRPFIALLQLRPAGLPAASCFPAGHASAGYAWVCLYFLALVVSPRWRWWGLACGLLLGALFGISQQLRGAHFMSHDISTLALCWFTSLLVYRWMYVPASAHDGVAVAPDKQIQPILLRGDSA
ncbi:phosphatase PAP2 family protein [Pseudoxanthomonas dokdonensis]|nr:phosphatase PAP2 family protein [Pseudoxanthomonas dokdonensis]